MALESSSDFCSLALSVNNRLFSRHKATPREHNQVIIPTLEALFREASVNLSDMDAVVYGRGPGSFTGIRIVAAVAQAISMTHDIPLHAVSSLSAMALSAPPKSHVLTLLDARLGELYWCAWQRQPDKLLPLTQEAVSTPQVLVDWLAKQAVSDWVVLGSGGVILERVWSLKGCSTDFECVPRASNLFPLMSSKTTGSPALELPIYLRTEAHWKK